jgi:hypothetical protein
MGTLSSGQKYGHHILLSSLDWTNHNKGSLHQTFWNSLIEFLRTDLDGNLSSTLNPLTASKLDYYLSSLQEGLSETANKGKFFDQQMLHQKSKIQFIDEIVDIALFATQIPLSIFTNLSKQRFEKHSMLESTLEILQQFYMQMETQSDEFYLFLVEIFPHTRYGVRDVASVLLLLVQLEKLYSMHPLQCCITGT